MFLCAGRFFFYFYKNTHGSLVVVGRFDDTRVFILGRFFLKQTRRREGVLGFRPRDTSHAVVKRI